jgi:chitodextrinase
MCYPEDMKNPKGNVVQTGWAFVGFIGDAKTQVATQQFPIGVYTNYCDGRAQANSWMNQEKRAIRWEANKIYEELEDA